MPRSKTGNCIGIQSSQDGAGQLYRIIKIGIGRYAIVGMGISNGNTDYDNRDTTAG